MKASARIRARERLDERLSQMKPTDRFVPPPRGWIRAIREALGMTGVQLARRLAISPQSVDAMEKSEGTDTIKLNTLRRAAEALNCTLVYVLVPKTSLEDTLQTRARQIATADLMRVAHTMKLEDQETSDTNLETRIERYIREHLREGDIWDPS